MKDSTAVQDDVQISDHLPADPGTPHKMVLYSTHDAWRYSIYTDRYSLEGRLSGYTTPDDAQRRAEAAAERILRRPLHLRWGAVDAGWWVAEIVTDD